MRTGVTPVRHDRVGSSHVRASSRPFEINSFGSAIRLAVGALTAAPEIEPWQKTISSVVHTSLYVLLVAMPIVGYIANSIYGAPTPFFGLFDLPPLLSKNEALATQLFTIHRWVGWLVIFLVLIHVSAALYHHFIRGDSVLKRMLPRAMGGL